MGGIESSKRQPMLSKTPIDISHEIVIKIQMPFLFPHEEPLLGKCLIHLELETISNEQVEHADQIRVVEQRVVD